jgi:hypothetical protein
MMIFLEVGLKNIVLSELSSATSRARPHHTHTPQTPAFRLSSVSSLVETDKLTWLGGSIFASLEVSDYNTFILTVLSCSFKVQ